MANSWPQTTAKFASKKPCKYCGAAPYSAGEHIYKIKEEYWCCNQNCPTPVQTQTSNVPNPGPANPTAKTGVDFTKLLSSTTETSTRVPQAKIDYSDHAWDIALAKSKSIYAHDPNILQRDIMILAQVFYKSYMGIV